MNKERLAARLLAVFLAELEEQVRAMNADLLALEAEPGDAARLHSLFRIAHTLKGAAGAAGVRLVEEVCHGLETRLAQAREGKLALGHEEFALFFAAVDALDDAGDRLRTGTGWEGAPLKALARTLRATPPARPRPNGEAAPAPAAPNRLEPAAAPAPVEPDVPGRPDEAPVPPAAAPNMPEPAAAAAPALGGQVRVEADKLGALLARAAQMQLAAQRIARRPQELQELHEGAARAAAEWRGVRRRLNGMLGESPPSLLRSVDRIEETLEQLAAAAGGVAARSVTDARTVSRLAGGIGHSALELRLCPFADACEALPRVVRDVAAAAGKLARLEVRGGEVEADRPVLRGLSEALLHLARNAVDHGIEPPEAREAAGKPRAGTVRVAAELRGDRLVVSVADDGAGIDASAIRARLRDAGLPVPDDERELVRALFRGGFSTRARVTEISGRGVGLDVVRASVERLRGTVDIRSVPGRGTTFVLETPLTLTTSRVLLVRVGGQPLALPTAGVERLERVATEQIRRADGRELIAGPAGPTPLVALARLLGPPLTPRAREDAVAVVRLVVNGRRLALEVDELVAEREVVVRPVGRLRAPPAYLGGAAVLGTGEVALVLDTAALVAAGLEAPPADAPAGPHERAAAAARRRILVVDDSISTRTLEQSILEAAGFEVLTAVDGADGWRRLQEHGADLVVTDIEMPRMDGFALCEAVRASRRFARLPIVLVTALETPEHRARGLEVGADAYLAKSSFDQENLLETIRQLIGEP